MAALTSVIAAICLTGLKIVVGFLTGSLSILAEAAHSGLDLVAALITYGAICISSKPADKEHLYGHGKVENLSALLETLLLLATCAWIISKKQFEKLSQMPILPYIPNRFKFPHFSMGTDNLEGEMPRTSQMPLLIVAVA